MTNKDRIRDLLDLKVKLSKNGHSLNDKKEKELKMRKRFQLQSINKSDA